MSSSSSAVVGTGPVTIPTSSASSTTPSSTFEVDDHDERAIRTALLLPSNEQDANNDHSHNDDDTDPDCIHNNLDCIPRIMSGTMNRTTNHSTMHPDEYDADEQTEDDNFHLMNPNADSSHPPESSSWCCCPIISSLPTTLEDDSNSNNQPTKITPLRATVISLLFVVFALVMGHKAGIQPMNEWRYFSWHPFFMTCGMIGFTGIGAVTKKVGGYQATKVRFEPVVNFHSLFFYIIANRFYFTFLLVTWDHCLAWYSIIIIGNVCDLYQ
jgi:hypothetical protein